MQFKNQNSAQTSRCQRGELPRRTSIWPSIGADFAKAHNMFTAQPRRKGREPVALDLAQGQQQRPHPRRSDREQRIRAHPSTSCTRSWPARIDWSSWHNGLINRADTDSGRYGFNRMSVSSPSWNVEIRAALGLLNRPAPDNMSVSVSVSLGRSQAGWAAAGWPTLDDRMAGTLRVVSRGTLRR